MARDYSGEEFRAFFVVILKTIVAIVAVRVLIMVLGFKIKVPIIDPFLIAVKNYLSGWGMSPLGSGL